MIIREPSKGEAFLQEYSILIRVRLLIIVNGKIRFPAYPLDEKMLQYAWREKFLGETLKYCNLSSFVSVLSNPVDIRQDFIVHLIDQISRRRFPEPTVYSVRYNYRVAEHVKKKLELEENTKLKVGDATEHFWVGYKGFTKSRFTMQVEDIENIIIPSLSHGALE